MNLEKKFSEKIGKLPWWYLIIVNFGLFSLAMVFAIFIPQLMDIPWYVYFAIFLVTAPPAIYDFWTVKGRKTMQSRIRDFSWGGFTLAKVAVFFFSLMLAILLPVLLDVPVGLYVTFFIACAVLSFVQIWY